MDYVRMKGTGLMVSRVCLGAMTFGGQTEEADAVRMVHYAMDQGVNFVDTADSYTEGRSEVITGKAIKGRRHEVILASKVCRDTVPGPNAGGLSRRHILYSVDETLKRLDTDFLDIYYCHFPDVHTPMEETMGVMTDLVRAGKVRYVGMSNHASWQIVDALRACDKINGCAPVITENVCNILTRGVESELVPCLRQHNMDMVVYNPLAGGLLTGKHKIDSYGDNTRFSINAGYRDRYWNETNFNAVEKIRAIAESAGMPMAELALKWCKAQDYITSVIIGASKFGHLEQNLEALNGTGLSKDVLENLDQIWNNLPVGSRFTYNR
ncbi:aldo/keto reductase [Anaerolentibacter hominis]|uniref:aldo/keto reductase n=1 Tax=Anaerolentibacter hominis TaxID=3079009 RepID=UPI0031B82FB5